MARNLRDLRRKMKAIRSTRQVTKAMELVAASKMRRATQSAVQLRRYALTAWKILETLAAIHPGLHPFLTDRTPRRILALLFSPDRGLCGSLNAQMFRMVTQYITQVRALQTSPELSFVAIGKKGQQFLLRSHQTIVAAFPAFSAHPQFRDILPIVRLATDGFLNHEYDSVVLLFPDFISALLQEPTSKVLLPFSKTSLKEMLDTLIPHKKGPTESRMKNKELRV
ncbi:F0F1 ATP synthase subunit gamma, partial [Candidatus Peregrinibacteria bacterium]|nr:F0F1 ATP synthase subunit gamma [Candidatus Peregrinibacteria bacterium]